jgi:hypothetical protein
MGQMLHTRGRLTATREKEKTLKNSKNLGLTPVWHQLTCDDLPNCAATDLPNPDEDCTFQVSDLASRFRSVTLLHISGQWPCFTFQVSDLASHFRSVTLLHISGQWPLSHVSGQRSCCIILSVALLYVLASDLAELYRSVTSLQFSGQLLCCSCLVSEIALFLFSDLLHLICQWPWVLFKVRYLLHRFQVSGLIYQKKIRITCY